MDLLVALRARSYSYPKIIEDGSSVFRAVDCVDLGPAFILDE